MNPKIERWHDKGMWEFQRQPYDLEFPCMIWLAGLAKGQAQASINGRILRVHRWHWEQEIGPIQGMLCHKCDRRNCIELTHLYDGTQRENSKDWKERGRSTTFPACGHAREGNTKTYRFGPDGINSRECCLICSRKATRQSMRRGRASSGP